MRRIIAVLLTLAAFIVTGGYPVAASQVESDDFNLVEYIENNEIQNPEEFNKVIETYTEYSSPEYSSESISYFKVNIDHDRNIVCVTTMGVSQTKGTETSNKATRDYYNDIGAKIFTISVTGRFSYSTGSCTTISKSGSFTKPFYSTWSSTPAVTSGNINASKAYAKISGSATSGGNTKTYSLTLTCDDTGHFTTY